MDKSDRSKFSEDENKFSKHRTISPAVLGVPNSYGMKLSLNVTSQKKKELFSKLEEWRRAREEKLAASILRKQKQAENSKANSASLMKNKEARSCNLNKSNNFQKIQDEGNVFERLYRNATKIKKNEISGLYPKKQLGSNSNLQHWPHDETKQVQNPKTTDENYGNDKGKFFDKNFLNFEDGRGQIVNADVMSKAQSVNVSKAVFDEYRLKKPEESHYFLEEFSSDTIKTTSVVNTDKLIHAENKSASQKENCTMFEASKTDEISSNSSEACIVVSGEHPKFLEKNIVEQKSLRIHFLPKSEKTQIKKNKFSNNQLHFNATKKNSFSASLKGKEFDKFKGPLRRSVSMLYRRKLNPDSAIHRTKSESIYVLKNIGEQNECEKKPVFLASENMLNGQSVTKTPCKTKTFDHLRTPSYLRKKLEDWLIINGHPLDKYRHLRCFGISDKTIKNRSPKKPKRSKEIITETSQPHIMNDYSNKENSTPLVSPLAAKDTDVENWLTELYRLISELKYPSGRCEEWLTAIRKKSPACTEMRIYWECLAALDEATKGEFEPRLSRCENETENSIGNSLAKLFDKMVIEQDNSSKSKLEKGLDPKNIFKSTVIKFAVQQKQPFKEFKKKDELSSPKQQYVATPVRRSSRIRTPSQSHVVSSLQFLTADVRSNTTFKPNKSLFTEE